MPELRRILEPKQLGAGTADGCVTLVNMLQEWVAQVSSAADDGENDGEAKAQGVLSVDFKNAYGQFLRSAAIKGLTAKTGAINHLVLSFWGNRSSTIWQRCEGQWRASLTARGGFQGTLLAMVMFCMSLEQSYSNMPVGLQDAVTRVGYQDDTYLVGNLKLVSNHWPSMIDAFATGGHIVNLVKTEAYLPCLENTPTEALQPELGRLFERIPRAVGGFKCLGNAAQGSLEYLLGPFQLSASPLRKRLAQAVQYGDRLIDFLNGSSEQDAWHIAWMHVCKSLSRALSYDARLVAPDVYKCVSATLDDKILQVVDAIAGERLPSRAKVQVSLPGALGGLSCRLPSSESEAAFISTCTTISRRIGPLSSALGRPVVPCTNQPALYGALQLLMEKGIVVTGDVVTFADEAKCFYNEGPWSKDIGHEQLLANTVSNPGSCQGIGSKMHGRIMRAIESLRATQLWSESSAFESVVLLSSGGQGSGKFWSQIPFEPGLFFPNHHFRMLMLMRLCCIDVPSGSVCQIPKADSVGDDFCGCALASPLVHPHLCKAGPARLRPHRGLANVLADKARRAGAHVDLERACPHLYQQQADGKILEAIMDVVFHFPGGPSVRHLDVTVRCPHAERYCDVESLPGVAAAAGVRDKLDRYDESVMAISMETYGRMSSTSIAHIRAITSDFVRPCSRQSPGLVYHQLRYSLEHALFFEIVDVVIQSLGGSSFYNWRPSRPRTSGPNGPNGPNV